MAQPSTLSREISPPPSRKRSIVREAKKPVNTLASENQVAADDAPQTQLGGMSLAAIEAGKVEIRDHLEFFSKRLSAASLPADCTRLGFSEYEDLYRRNQHANGCHFVVHQHDHPISGVHYDLRLQFSQTSSISFAIPYGLPGNPNSIRPNRMAIETRVHNLWNHLIETASHATGSLLIWDTGEYEVLPRDEAWQPTTDDELSDKETANEFDQPPQNERLFQAFQSNHIRLRLHGARLPAGYTISLRLPRANIRSTQPRKPERKRRRTDPAKLLRIIRPVSTDSDSSPDSLSVTEDLRPIETEISAAVASEDDEDDTVRVNNAYAGATNSIGSVHQRHWFLTLDRRRSGLWKTRTGPDRGRWAGAWPAFFVRGREHERSVLTGRLAGRVMEDEGVAGFVGRKMWRAITE